MSDTEAPAAKLASVPIVNLLQHPAFQVRDGFDAPTVERYTNRLRHGLSFPRVKIGVIKSANRGQYQQAKPPGYLDLLEGTYVLLDGFHRVRAHQNAGLTHVDAELIECTEREARWIAAEANSANALPLKRSEHPKVLEAYILAEKYLTKRGKPKQYREIALDLGGIHPHTTVRNWIKKYHPWLFRLMRDSDTPWSGESKERAPVENPSEQIMRDSVTALETATKAVALLTSEQRFTLRQMAEKLAALALTHGVKEPPPEEF